MNARRGAPIQTAVATPEDLAILWSFIGGLRCVLTPVVGGWQIRIECGHAQQNGPVIKTGSVRAGRRLGAGDVQPSLSGDDDVSASGIV